MCFKKLKSLFSDPSKFFKDVGKEKDYWTVLKFFVVVYIVAAIIQILVLLPVNLELPEFVGPLNFILIGLLAAVILAFISPFIGSFLSHLGILLFGGREGFFNTFKAISYSMIILIGYNLVSSIIVSAILLLNPDKLTASNHVGNIFSSIGWAHVVVVGTIGVSMYHSISKAKAFFGIILVPLVLILILTLLIFRFTPLGTL